MITTTVRVTPDTQRTLESRTQNAETLSDVLSKHVQRTVEIDHRDRFVVVQGKALQQLEEILKGGSILNGGDLARKVADQTGILVGGVRLEFTPAQLEEIVRRAERLSLTPEELTRRIVQRMEGDFFTNMGRIS